MPISKAKTVAAYLAELPAPRREVMSRVRAVIRKHLPKGYRESMAYGMIAWELPLATYPDTYNGKPLCYAGLAAQKSHFSLYLTGAYSDPRVEKALKAGFRKAGKKLDMGKSCIRFRTAEDLPLDVIADAVASLPPRAFVARYEAARR